MEIADFNASIRAAIDFFSQRNIWASTVYEISLPRSVEFNQLNLTSKDYIEIYDCGLSLSHYNLLLTDFSYFQFSYSSPFEYALAFYPNPRMSGSREAVDLYKELQREHTEGRWSDEEFSELIAEIQPKIYIPRIRFEYSGSQYRNVRHPGAHFHIGMSGEDRWPSARKLSPKSFSLLMAKLYFPDKWWPQSRFSHPAHDQHLHLHDCLDNKLVLSIQSDGVSQFLSNDEMLGFHFAALQGRQP